MNFCEVADVSGEVYTLYSISVRLHIAMLIIVTEQIQWYDLVK